MSLGVQLVLVRRQFDNPVGLRPKNGINIENIGPKPPRMFSKFSNYLVALPRKVTTFQTRVKTGLSSCQL